MPQVPLHGIGMKGLNQDTPSFAQDHTTFNAGLNLRPFNGSLQGVYSFDENVQSNVHGPIDDVNGDHYFVAASGISSVTATGTGDDRMVSVNLTLPPATTFTASNSRIIVRATGATDIETGTFTISESNTRFTFQSNTFPTSGIISFEIFRTSLPRVTAVSGNTLTVVQPSTPVVFLGGDTIELIDNTGAVQTRIVDHVPNAANTSIQLTSTPPSNIIGRPCGRGPRHIYGMTQWTTTGEGQVNLAYAFGDPNDLSLQIVRDIEGTSTIIQGAHAGSTGLDFDDKFDLDIIPFNELLIINDGESQPTFSQNRGTPANPEYITNYILGWPNGGSSQTAQTDYWTDTTVNVNTSAYAVGDSVITMSATVGTSLSIGQLIAFSSTSSITSNADDLPDNRVYSVEAINGAVVTLDRGLEVAVVASANVLGRTTGRVTAQRITTFNNRLIALNVSQNWVDGGNASILWSTPISQLNSLNGVTFIASTSNSAGDDIITETPGEVLDAGQLGNNLIVYKSDSVFVVTDTGDPLYLVAQQIFNDDGLLTPGCFTSIGSQRHFVVGENGIYIHDGGVNKTNVAKGRVEDYFYNNMINPNRTFLFHQQHDKEVWVCYSHMGNTGVGVNRALIYNYELDAWHERELINDTRGITASNLDGSYTVYRWGMGGTHTLSNTSYLSGGYADFDRHDLGDATMTKRIHGLYPQTENMVDVRLKSSDDLADPPMFDDVRRRTFDPTMQYKVDYRLYGRYFDLQIIMNQTTNPKLTGLHFDITPGGRR